MKINIKDTLTLSDDNNYIVVGKITYQDNVYYYLIDKDNITNIKFCVENKIRQSLFEVEDKELIQKLLPLFLKSATSAITKEDLELMETIAE